MQFAQSVRRGLSLGLKVYGVRHGYSGHIAGDFVRLLRDAGGIIDAAALCSVNVLLPSVSLFSAGQEAAVEQLAAANIPGLVVVLVATVRKPGAHALLRSGVSRRWASHQPSTMICSVRISHSARQPRWTLPLKTFIVGG